MSPFGVILIIVAGAFLGYALGEVAKKPWFPVWIPWAVSMICLGLAIYLVEGR